MQITNRARGMVEKTLMQCIISYFEVLFSLNFWMKEGLLHHVEIFRQTGLFKNCQCIILFIKHLKFSRLPYGRMAILGWNLGVQNVITYHRTPDYICYIFFLIFFRIQKTKEEQSALLKTSFCQKKDSFWFVKYSVWWQKCFQILHKTWIEMWKVWKNDNFIWKSKSETNFIE